MCDHVLLHHLAGLSSLRCCFRPQCLDCLVHVRDYSRGCEALAPDRLSDFSTAYVPACGPSQHVMSRHVMSCHAIAARHGLA